MTAAGTVGVRGRGAAGSSPRTATAGTPRPRRRRSEARGVRAEPCRAGRPARPTARHRLVGDRHLEVEAVALLGGRRAAPRSDRPAAGVRCRRAARAAAPAACPVVGRASSASCTSRAASSVWMPLATAARTGRSRKWSSCPRVASRVVREDDRRRARACVDLPGQLHPHGLGAVGGRHAPAVGQGGDDLEPAPGGAALGEVDHACPPAGPRTGSCSGRVSITSTRTPGPAGRRVTVYGGPRVQRGVGGELGHAGRRRPARCPEPQRPGAVAKRRALAGLARPGGTWRPHAGPRRRPWRQRCGLGRRP